MATEKSDPRLPLRFGRTLTPVNFERVFRGSRSFSKREKGWTKQARDLGILIDLSRVEHAEFSGLARVALVVEGAARWGIHVCVALPLCQLREGEKRFIQEFSASHDPQKEALARIVKERPNIRERVLGFMRRTGFIRVINVAHVPDSHELVEVRDDYDVSIEVAVEPDETGLDDIGATGGHARSDRAPDSDSSLTSIHFRHIFPLQWVSLETEDRKTEAHFLEGILGLTDTDLGLSLPDAQMMGDTIVQELAENVQVHAHDKTKDPSHGNPSCAPRALVGAILLDPEKYGRAAKEYGGENQFSLGFKDFWRDLLAQESPLARVVVGDSGRGIPEALKEHFRQKNEKEIPIEHFSDELTPTEKVLFWAFNRWSTSEKRGDPDERGTRGLWLILRLVRAYRGSVSLRAETAYVGFTFMKEARGLPIRNPRPGAVPGTLVDVCLPTRRKKEDSRRDIPWVQSDTALPEFDLIPVAGGTASALDRQEEEQIITSLAMGVPGKEPRWIVVASDERTTGSVRETEHAIERLLAKLSRLANHGAVILLLPRIPREVLQVAVEAISEARKTKARKAHLALDLGAHGSYIREEPILLLYAPGSPLCVGGSMIVEQIIRHLLQPKRPHAQVSDLSSGLPTGTTPEDLERALRDVTDWIQPGEDQSLRLRYPPAALDAEIADEVAKRIASAIRESPSEHGVRRGYFRTPTLAYVNRWIDTKTLLDKTVGIGTAAYVLAGKIRNHPRLKGLKNVEVVRTDTASTEIARCVARCLDFPEPKYLMPGELDAYSPHEAPRVPEGTRVLLCSDLVLTGNSVERALADLIRWGAIPVGVACILDAREERAHLSGKIPVASVTEVAISANANDTNQWVDIDPVMHEPSSLEREHVSPAFAVVDEPEVPSGVSSLWAPYDIPPEVTLRWCSEVEGSLCYDHIVRPVGRHFPIYLNAMKLLREHKEARKIILGRYVRHVQRWMGSHKSLPERDGSLIHTSLEIWCPSGRMSRKLADRLRQELVDNSQIQHILPVREIPRAAGAGRWVLPLIIEQTGDPAHVIIVDWGAITATTVQQLTRLAAWSGALSVRAIVFLSQMPLEDELQLTGLRSVSGRRLVPKNGESGDRDMATQTEYVEGPVECEVTFLSSIALGIFSRAMCPTCEILRTLDSASEGTLPNLLQEHAQDVEERWREVEREDALSRKDQSDFYRVPVRAREIADVLEWRGVLDAALLSTGRRFECANRLTSEAEDPKSPGKKTALVRLLATEPLWLKLPPLRLADVRKTVARIARGLALDAGNHVGVREQAVVVLRAASKNMFLESLPNILKGCGEERRLVRQLLFGVLTFLRRSYHEQADRLDLAYKKLSECGKILAPGKQPGTGQEGAQSRHYDLVACVRFLASMADLVRTRLGVTEARPKEIWRMLREDYAEPLMHHDPLITQGAAIRTPLSSQAYIENPPSQDDWRGYLAKWNACQDTLVSRVLPRLERIGEILLSDHYSRRLEAAAFERLKSTISDRTPLGLSRLGDLLADFARKPGLFRDERRRREYTEEVTWWYGLFLQKEGGDGSGALQLAKIADFLLGCPANLAEALKEILMEVRNEGFSFEHSGPDPGVLDTDVFCDRQFLRSVLKHIVKNALETKHRSREALGKTIRLCIKLVVDEKAEDDRMTLVVKNDGTKRRTSGEKGYGLIALNRQLRPFGAKAEGDIIGQGQWTYEARLEVERW